MPKPVRSIKRVVAALLAIVWTAVGIGGFLVAARSGHWWWVLPGLFACWYALVWALVVKKGRLVSLHEASRPWRGADSDDDQPAGRTGKR